MTDINISDILKRTALFLAVCAVITASSIVLFTNIGAHALFRIGVRLNACEVDIGDRAHLEYYNAKDELDGYANYRIFVDGNNSAGWDAAFDFLKFIKQNCDVTAVCLDGIDIDRANAYLAGENIVPSDLTSEKNVSDFVVALNSYNALQPPQKRVHFSPLGTEKSCYIIDTRSYSHEYAADDIMDVSVIYIGKEDCDTLFDVPSLFSEGRRLRFGDLDSLEFYIGALESVSGNFGEEKFGGVGQPEFYFLVETGSGE